MQVALDNELWNAALRGYNNLGVMVTDQDRHHEVLETITPAALKVARKFGSRLWEDRMLAAEVYELVAVGRWDDAVTRGEEMLAAASGGALTRGSIIELLPLSMIYVQRGQLGDARRILMSMPDAETSGDIQERATYLSYLAPILRTEGRLHEALEAAEGAFAAGPELGMRSGVTKDGAVEVLEAALALGDVAKVEEMLGIVAAIRPGESSPFLQAQGARFSARLATLRSEAAVADAGSASAIAMFRELEMPFWVAVAVLERGEWLVSVGRDPEASSHFEEARTIFELLKAAPWLERVGGVHTRQG